MRYVTSSIASHVPNQFPEFYQDEGPILVEFTKAYYEWLESQNHRNFSELVDIDTTFEYFLIYYKRKYLRDLPFVNYSYDDIRFIVKHIADLYSRKGTEESLKLLFKMFFKQEVEVFYPATSILKISDSLYTNTRFIEFKAVNKIQSFPLKKGDVIRGDTSLASAYIDDIVFYNIRGSITPVAYISNVYGRFSSNDGLEVERGNEKFYPGPIIYGSINGSTVLRKNNRPNNQVGDKLFLISSNFGTDATASVEEVSQIPSGVIEWSIPEPGFGYSTREEDNEIFVSTQALVLAGEEPYPIYPFDTVSAEQREVFAEDPANPLADAETNRVFSGFGTVIAYEHPILYVQTTPEDVIIPREGAFVTIGFDTNGIGQFVPFPDAGATTIEVSRTGTNYKFDVQVNTLAEYNDSAKFQLATFDYTENIKVIPDVIGDYADVRLDSLDYGMSGEGPETIDTQLRYAFTPIEYNIGALRRLRVLDTGTDYKNNVRTIIRFPAIKEYDYKDLAIVFDKSDFIISEGDILEQEILIEDLEYDPYYTSEEWTGGDPQRSGYRPYTARAQFLRREGNVFYFRPKSYHLLKKGSLTFKARQLNILFVFEDPNSRAMGNNADVTGESELLIGQIKRIKILQSGFKYRNKEEVMLVNQQTGKQVAYAELQVGGMGETDGQWVTTSSHLNDSGKFIHDNLYYQEYSYDVSSILDPNQYEKVVKDIVHVAGTKMFSSPLINTINDIRPNADVGIESWYFSEVPFRVEQANNLLLGTEDGVDNWAQPSANSEILNAVLVNFNPATGLILPYVDGSIPLYGTVDRSLDSWDETFATFDNTNLTFDRE